jgi:hypothetical protein
MPPPPGLATRHTPRRGKLILSESYSMSLSSGSCRDERRDDFIVHYYSTPNLSVGWLHSPAKKKRWRERSPHLFHSGKLAM